MRATRITAEMVQIPLRGSSAFLLLDERVTIIDSGLPGSAPALLAMLRRLGRSADEVEQVLISHYHPDHLGGLAALLEHLPARVGVHAAEAAAVRGDQPIPSPLRLPATLGRHFPTFPWIRHCPVDTVLRDGDELPVLGGLRVVHTPGHTPGHVSFLLPERGVLIAGDALQRRRFALPAGRARSGRAADDDTAERSAGRRVPTRRGMGWSQELRNHLAGGGALTTPARIFSADWPEALRSVHRIAALEFDILALSHFPPIRSGGSSAVRRLARTLPDAQ